MLISEFARTAGITMDTARFYIRLRLLTPATGSKGGRNAYHSFGDEDLRAVEMIRVAQALGMSLKEIASVVAERQKGRVTRERKIEITTALLLRLDLKAADLQAMAGYLRAKIEWLEAGQPDHLPEPGFPLTSDRGPR